MTKSSSMWDNLKIVNSSVRTLMVVVFLGLFCFLGWIGYTKYVLPGFETEKIRKEMAELQKRFEDQEKELVKVRTALKLLKVDRRRASLKVLEKGVDPATSEPWFDVEFTEIGTDGVPISTARKFRLKGSIVYVDARVVKFEDKHIEGADELRGASICVFKGLWGDGNERAEHLSLDAEPGVRTAYGDPAQRSEFENKLWENFWEIANNRELQEEMGVRANHGQVNYIEVEAGKTYDINLRSSDGLTIQVSRNNNT
jgi:hypothetical protein